MPGVNTTMTGLSLARCGGAIDCSIVLNAVGYSLTGRTWWF